MTTGSMISRTDPATGVVEEIGYFGDTPQMMGWTHIPGGDAVAGLVICSSTHAELLKAYHLEVQLARELADSGIAVQRFHYRGDGNSGGDPRDLTLSAMVAAATEAQNRLADRVSVERFAFVGVRLGAFPAARLAERTTSSSLLLWDPVLDADKFFREAIRSHAISAIKGESKPEGIDAVLARLKEEGSVELLGYEIMSEFHESIAGKVLVDLAPAGGSVYLVPFGSTDMSPLIDGWSQKGIDVSELDGTAKEAWWLDEQASEDRIQRTSVLVSASADWIKSRFGL